MARTRRGRRDGRPDLDGVLVVDKPAGMTSHDVVQVVRRVVGQRRVGHTGTLDPDATGVLVVCLGRAARLVQYLQAGRKTYAATMVLGRETSSQDASGEVLSDVDASHVDEHAVCVAMTRFQGDIEQVPPMVSALKVDGERLHEKARRGETVERDPRPVTIHDLVLEDFRPGRQPEVSFLVTCSAGTYVRTLAHDIGQLLGVGGSLTSLRRIANGPFTVDDAVSPRRAAGRRRARRRRRAGADAARGRRRPPTGRGQRTRHPAGARAGQAVAGARPRRRVRGRERGHPGGALPRPRRPRQERAGLAAARGPRCCHRPREPGVNDTDLTHVAWSLDDVEEAASVVTIGFFDGVHRGHQTIIRRAVREAEDRGVRSVAVTFDRHPMEVVRPGSQPRYLQSRDRKVAALVDQGVDLVLVIPFDLARSQQPPEEFVTGVLAGPLQAVKVVVGTNFRFGHRAAGDVVLLADLGDALGFDTEAVSLLHLDDTPISSTEIREHLERGDVAWAAEALGRPFVLEGAVVRGDGRGRSIGIPTANVEVDERMQVPAGGVYAGRASVVGREGSHLCVVNIGTRPTFGGTSVTVEAHLLDVDLDLYGEHLAVHFLQRLRDEQRFDGVDALVAQIHTDIDTARSVLG